MKKLSKKKPVKAKKTVKKPAKKPVKKPVKAKKPAPKKAVLKKKPAAAPAPKPKPKPKIKGTIIGAITHYFPHVRAAVIKLKAPLTVGDKIKIKGHTTDFQQEITSLQIDRVPITRAKKGDEIGLLVDSRVRQHDTVYKV